MLQGGFAPIHQEYTVTDLPVTGTIPAHLDGRYLRNGPNPVAGFVKLLRLRLFSGERVSFPGPPRPLGSPLRTRHFGPTLKSVPHFLAILRRGQQMTSRSEVLGNRTVRGEKPLRMSR